MGRHIYFRDRRDAGRQLAQRLLKFAGQKHLVVLGLARGGVPVASEVAQVLRAPLDVFIIRKLGVPNQRELAMGAIASGGVRVLNHEVLIGIRDAETVLEEVAAREGSELERREREYRAQRPAVEIRGQTVIVVDDGLATGASARAAVRALRQHAAEQIIVAVPVGPPSVCQRLEGEVDELICLVTPADFDAVGQVYDDFSQTTDGEVRVLLAEAARRPVVVE
jgi:predicted phosphoribosyltransferase